MASAVCGVVAAIMIGSATATANYAASNAGTKNWNTRFSISEGAGAVLGWLGGGECSRQVRGDQDVFLSNGSKFGPQRKRLSE